jgi:DNA polymerase I-like protein with 3'-5' exonuclease and polymerase domains
MVGCSIGEAKKFISDYDLRLPAVPRFMEESIALAKRKGVVTDPYGRDYPVDRGFEYRATNYLVQGTAAGVAKGAMRRVDTVLSTKWECRADLLLQIHDEFLIEVDKEADCHALRQDVVRAMSFDYKMLGCPIPFPVGYKIATERWSVNQEVEVAA